MPIATSFHIRHCPALPERSVPLRKIISDEMILRYGAMQVECFRAAREARQRINASVAAIEARREFWLANTDLNVVVVGGGISGTNEASRTMAAGTAEPAGRPLTVRENDHDVTKRIRWIGAVLAGASLVSGRVQAASIPEAPTTTTNTMQPPIAASGDDRTISRW